MLNNHKNIKLYNRKKKYYNPFKAKVKIINLAFVRCLTKLQFKKNKIIHCYLYNIR